MAVNACGLSTFSQPYSITGVKCKRHLKGYSHAVIAAQLCVTVVDISDAEKEAYAKLAGPYVLNLLYRGSWKRAVLEYSGGIFTRSCTM